MPYISTYTIFPIGLRQWTYKRHYARPKESFDPLHEKAQAVKENASNHLVLATLIATVSFTAGFTLPGGFDQNIGMALLTRKVSFKAFLVSDAMAFTFSGLAVICYYLVVMRRGLLLIDLLYRVGRLLIALSLGMLMIAFVSGVCAMVIESGGLYCNGLGHLCLVLPSLSVSTLRKLRGCKGLPQHL